MSSPVKRKGTPITRTQDDIVARLRAILERQRHDDDERRDNALVHLLDRQHAEELMDRDVQGDEAVDRLLENYPTHADLPTREQILDILRAPQPGQLVISLARVLDRAWSLRQDLMLLSEYGWALGKDGLDEQITADAAQAVHTAFVAVARFHRAYNVPLPGEDDGTMHPALAEAARAVDEDAA